jgi:hypothetical protein
MTKLQNHNPAVKLPTMFGGIKDSLSSAAAKSLLASRLDRYVNLTELKIRSRDRTISAELILEGEEVPITILIESYRIAGVSGAHTLTVEKLTTSKAWLQNLLDDLIVGKPLPVPSIVLLALGKSED